MDDESKEEYKADDITYISNGHIARIAGNEPYKCMEFSHMENMQKVVKE